MSSTLVFTPLEEINSIHTHLKESYHAGKLQSVEYRKEQLLQLAYLFQDNKERFVETLKKDLGRPELETYINDIGPVINECIYAHKQVDSWVKPYKPPFQLDTIGMSPTMHPQPKGVVLVISPFNYPIWCSTAIIGAIAAGCPFVLKPSELNPATSQLLAELFPKYLDQDFFRVVNGAVEETTRLLALEWAHIVYTGSGRIGRIVATAAAKHLTPVTLELGGKSPVVVDSNTDFDLLAKRTLWGRMMNAGQTCIAPEYILVQESAQTKVVEAFKKQYKIFYGDDPKKSDSFGRICAHTHWDRITGWLQKTQGRIVLGGDYDRESKYIAPTIIQDVSLDDPIMAEELFGPILAIVPIPNISVGLEYIRKQENPLVLYAFSKDRKFREYVRQNTLSGMFVENDVIIHGTSVVTPFGGVGASGYGGYKGKYSFDMFSHYKPCFNSPKWRDLFTGLRFPPYTPSNVKRIKAFLVPTIPHARPGQPAPFNWKKLVVHAVLIGIFALNKDRLLAALLNLRTFFNI